MYFLLFNNCRSVKYRYRQVLKVIRMYLKHNRDFYRSVNRDGGFIYVFR